MALSSHATTSPQDVLDRAGSFLATEPVHHNLVLTLLHTRVHVPEPGRYWTVADGEDVVGVVLQSPLQFFATLTPMSRDAIAVAVDAIVADGAEVPGVNGEAGVAADFAGAWSERTRRVAVPALGQRLYEHRHDVDVQPTPGSFRRAGPADRELLVEWTEAFAREIDEPLGDAAAVVDLRLAARQLFVWDDDGPVAFAGISTPVCDVVRIGPVYTPPAVRNRGAATALVAALTRGARDRGRRCVLYTDLANPTSNSVYRRIGYRAVAECLRYHFHPAAAAD